MILKKTHATDVAAAKAGFSRATGFRGAGPGDDRRLLRHRRDCPPGHPNVCSIQFPLTHVPPLNAAQIGAIR